LSVSRSIFVAVAVQNGDDAHDLEPKPMGLAELARFDA